MLCGQKLVGGGGELSLDVAFPGCLIPAPVPDRLRFTVPSEGHLPLSDIRVEGSCSPPQAVMINLSRRCGREHSLRWHRLHHPLFLPLFIQNKLAFIFVTMLGERNTHARRHSHTHAETEETQAGHTCRGKSHRTARKRQAVKDRHSDPPTLAHACTHGTLPNPCTLKASKTE